MADLQASVLISDHNGLARPLDDVVQELCTVETLNGRYVIHLPVVTAFGSMVSVSLWQEGAGETYLVSDDGSAYREASVACASDRTFNAVAKAKCERVGAHFDGGTMLFMRVTPARLKGALITMGSLIKEVVDETIEKSFAAKVDNARENFVRNVALAFPQVETIEAAQVTGFSTAQYEVDVFVDTGDVRLAFDYFSKSGNAVNAAYAKLSDISRRDDGPVVIGVTPSLKAIGPKLSLISSVAKVIRADVETETISNLAA